MKNLAKFLHVDSQSLCINLCGLAVKAMASQSKGREFESRCGQDVFFRFVNLASAPCSKMKPMQMKSTLTYT